MLQVKLLTKCQKLSGKFVLDFWWEPWLMMSWPILTCTILKCNYIHWGFYFNTGWEVYDWGRLRSMSTWTILSQDYINWWCYLDAWCEVREWGWSIRTKAPWHHTLPLNIANIHNIDLIPATPLNIFWLLLISMNSFYPLNICQPLLPSTHSYCPP